MVKSLFDQSQDIDKQIEALKQQKIELKAQLDKVRIKKLDEAGIESEDDLDILLGLQPSEEAMDAGQDVYSPDGQVIVLSQQDDAIANTGYILYKLDNGNLLFVKADSQSEIRDEFERVADDLAKTIDEDALKSVVKPNKTVTTETKDAEKQSVSQDTASVSHNMDNTREKVDMDKYQRIVDGVMSDDQLAQINQLQEKLNNGYK